jgi:DNA polymerase
MTRPARERGAFIFDAHAGVVGVDLETCSAADLKHFGAWAYAMHRSTRVWVMSFAYFRRDKPASAVLRWYPGEPAPPELLDFLQAGGQLLAHNAAFERAIWSNVLEPRYGFPPVELDQWVDTQAIGCELNLPRSLEGLATALGTDTQKDKQGAALMRRLAKADIDEEGDVVYPACTAEELERLALYCDDDVLAMGEAWGRMKPLPLAEARVWELDKRVNSRGVFLDQDYAKRVRKLAKRRVERLKEAAQIATFCEIPNAVAPPKLKTWLKSRGVDLPKTRKKNSKGEWYIAESTDKRALEEILGRADLPADVREVLVSRQEATKETSLRKLNRVDVMVGADGRLRDALQYCAAGTGRWSSSGLQIHNLPKDRLSPVASDLVDVAIETDCIETLELAEKRPLAALSQKLRSVIAAPPGRDLIAADFASIEACVLAWLAGQDDKLEFLHDYFGELARFRRGERPSKPQDLYEFAAESIGSDSRSLGKVSELALGYGMGDFKFADTAAAWGVPMDLPTAARVKRAWRATNRMIVEFWKELESAAVAAVRAPGAVLNVGRLRVASSEACLAVGLPSARLIRYWRPSVEVTVKKVKWVNDEGEVVEAEIEGPELRFFSQNDARTGMTPETTYGGKLVENATQAVARDLLAEALLRVDPIYPVVMHVHDSIASEVAEGTGDVDEFCEIMSAVPKWATGCPIDADGYRGKRFRG